VSVFANIEKISGEREPGPSPSFSSAHVLLAFVTIGDAGMIGRQSLAEKVGLGGGSVRTVVNKLRDEGLIRVIASGCSLTPKGKDSYEKVATKMSGVLQLDSSQLTVGAKQSAVAVRQAASKVRRGIEQRDSAIRVGASGATTYVIRGTKFAIPGGSSDCEREFPGPAWTKLREVLEPDDGDAVVVSGAESSVRSTLGAVSAALTLV